MPAVAIPALRRYDRLGRRVWRSTSGTHYIDFGSDSRLDDNGTAAVLTLSGWLYLTATPGAAERMGAKDGGGNNAWRIETPDSTGAIRVVSRRNPTNMVYTTSSTPLARLNRWLNVAITLNTGAGSGSKAAVFVGTETDPPASQSMTVGNEGSGTFGSDASYNLTWAARSSGGAGMPGFYGPVAFWQRVLSRRELVQWWSRPWSLETDPVFCAWPDGRGRFEDISRQGLHGIIAGGVLAPAPPWLGRRRRTRRWWAIGPLGGAVDLQGSAAGTLTASGALSVAVALASSASATLTATGDLVAGKLLEGTATGALLVSGALTVAVALSGAATGQVTATADMAVAIQLAGSAGGTLSATGDLLSGKLLVGSATMTLTVSGSLRVAVALAGAAAATLTAEATLLVAVQFSGAATGVLTTTGALTVLGVGTITGPSRLRHVTVRSAHLLAVGFLQE